MTTDNTIAKFLHDYYVKHPDEKDSSVDEETQLFRWRAVEACMKAGIPLEKIDDIRTLLERGGKSLTASCHLRSFVPKIEHMELATIIEELKNQKVCLIFDGTTRQGEATAVLMRWCDSTFEIKQRLIALRTIKKHMNGDSLGPFLIDIIGQVGVGSRSVVCVARDSCSTNGKAERNVKPILSNSVGMLCVSHTLSHCAEHVDLPVLKDFMTPWLSLVQHHPSAKSIWKDQIGSAMKGFSTIRWFSREECCNEIALNFSALPDFIDQLVQDDIGEALPRKMQEIMSSSAKQLQLELACNLDMSPILKACYTLEGDGLAVLLARRKLDTLLSWGDSLGDDASSMPNVAALLRSQIDISRPGAKVYEYFADTTPPAWFKGQVVAPRVSGKITIHYQDGTKIEQEEHEVRQWLEVRELDEWKRLSKAAKAGIQYLRNRLTGNLPSNQRNYDCSHMFAILDAAQAFDPSWAATHLDSIWVSALSIIPALEELIPQLQQELHAYVQAAKVAVIDHTESQHDHSFTQQVLKFFKENHSDFKTWAHAARIVFSFTPNSAAAERVFSLLSLMFGARQDHALGDYIQAAIMLRYNNRVVGCTNIIYLLSLMQLRTNLLLVVQVLGAHHPACQSYVGT